MPKKKAGEQITPEVLHVTPIGRDTMAAKALFEELTQGKGREEKVNLPTQAVNAILKFRGGGLSGPRPVVLYLDKQGIRQLRRILKLPEPSKSKKKKPLTPEDFDPAVANFDSPEDAVDAYLRLAQPDEADDPKHRIIG